MSMSEADLVSGAALLPQYIHSLVVRTKWIANGDWDEAIPAIDLSGMQHSAFFLAVMQVIATWSDKELRHSAADLMLRDMLLWLARDDGATQQVVALYDAMDKWYA